MSSLETNLNFLVLSFFMNREGDASAYVGEISARIKDLEERNRALKDRLLLIGENLIDIKENLDKKILDMKKDIEILKQGMERTISFLETISKEFSKFAKKEDLDILARQAKMFQPLEFRRKKD